MKRNLFVRLFALLLTLVMTVSILPVPARAELNLDAFEEFKKSSTRISGKFSDEKFWRTNRSTYPFEFDKAMKLKGFTMDYEITEVSKGTIYTNTKFEIYVRTTANKWKSVKSFTMKYYEKTIDVKFSSAMTIDAVAVVCLQNGKLSYSYTFTLYNPIDASSSNKSTTDTTKATNPSYSSGDTVSGYWSSEKFYRNGRWTNPYEFNSPLKSCTGFTLHYNIDEVHEGNMTGNFKYGVWARTSSGKWKLLKEFKMDSYSKTVKVTCQRLTIEAIAVVCQKTGYYSYTHSLSVTDPKVK